MARGSETGGLSCQKSFFSARKCAVHALSLTPTSVGCSFGSMPGVRCELCSTAQRRFHIRLILNTSLELFKTRRISREDMMITRETMTGWGPRIRHIAFSLFAALAVIGQEGQSGGAVEAAKPGERFEVTSVKAVRPTLVDTIAALQKRDIAAAKTAFAAYDSLWNGIEMYVNTRSKDMYDALEHVLQARI